MIPLRLACELERRNSGNRVLCQKKIRVCFWKASASSSALVPVPGAYQLPAGKLHERIGELGDPAWVDRN